MTTTQARPATAASSGELSHRQILTILSGLMLGMFLAALDQTIVSTAIKTIGNDLNNLSAQAWVTTAFLITSTIAAPLFGKLSDLFGRKRLFMLAIVIFIVGSALCGLATSMYELAAFRAFQGIGAGGIMPLALAIIGDIIPPRQRARYQGYMMAVFASASVLGPVLGGLLAGTSDFLGVSGWRWIFYINVPIAIAALWVVARVLKIDFVRRHRRVDWGGAVMLGVGLVPLLIVSEQGSSWGWASGAAFACYLIGVAGLVAFVWIQHRMGEDALLPLRLFKSGTFAVASAQITIIGMAMFGALSVLPLYLQIVKGASPTRSGLLLLPLMGGLIVSSLSSGQFTMRTGRYKILPVIGSLLMAISLGLMTQIGADTPLWMTDTYMGLFGIGLGMNMQSLVLAMQNSVPAKDMGVASASSTFFRSIGGTIGASVLLSILFSLMGSKVNGAYAAARNSQPFIDAVKAQPGQLASLQQHLSGRLDDTSFLSGLNSAIVHPFYVGFSQAGDVVFAVATVLMIGAFVLSLFLKEVPLRLVSGNQARSADAAAAETIRESESGAAAGIATATVTAGEVTSAEAADAWPDGQGPSD